MKTNQSVKDTLIKLLYKTYYKQIKKDALEYYKIKTSLHISLIINLILVTIITICNFFPINKIIFFTVLFLMIISNFVMVFISQHLHNPRKHFQEQRISVFQKVIRDDSFIFDLLSSETEFNLFRKIKSFILKIITAISLLIGYITSLVKATKSSLSQLTFPNILNIDLKNLNHHKLLNLTTLVILTIVILLLLIKLYDLVIIRILKITIFSKHNELMILYILAYHSPIIKNDDDSIVKNIERLYIKLPNYSYTITTPNLIKQSNT